MTKIDRLLAQIGALPLDPRLAAIEGAVLAGLAQAHRPAVPQTAYGAIAGLGLVAGILASTLSPTVSRHANPYPVGVPGALVPSTLLGESP